MLHMQLAYPLSVCDVILRISGTRRKCFWRNITQIKYLNFWLCAWQSITSKDLLLP